MNNLMFKMIKEKYVIKKMFTRTNERNKVSYISKII